MPMDQRRAIDHARIAVVGAGGTGCGLLPLLAAMPVAAITVIDGDTVEAVNLPRQLLFAPGDVGRPKVQAAVDRLRPMGTLAWRPEFRFIDPANARTLLAGHHLVADCTDDLAARQLIERTCHAEGIPLVSGSVHARQLQVVTVQGPGHRFFQGRTSEEQMGCDMRTVPAAVTTLAASLMALRIADILAGGDGLAGIMDLVAAANGRWLRLMGAEATGLTHMPGRTAPSA